MSKKVQVIENVLFAIIILSGIFIRMINLGSLPLGETEAGYALNAFSIINGAQISPTNQPLYASLTSILFFVFGSSEFLSRLTPLIFGCALIFIPYLLRSKIGIIPALFGTLFIAFDPGLIALSRQSGSSIISITLVLIALTAFGFHKYKLSGVLLGLWLFGGTSTWLGLILLLLACGLAMVFFEKDELKININSKKLFQGFLFGAFVLGGMFFLFPMSYSGLSQSMVDFVKSWKVQPEFNVFALLITLVKYHPLILILSVISGIIGWTKNDKKVQYLSMIAVLALILLVVFPGKTVQDLVWLILPLILLSVYRIGDWLKIDKNEILQTSGVTLVGLILFVFMMLNAVSAFYAKAPSTNNGMSQWLIIVAAILMIAAIVLLVGWGWSWKIAFTGFFWSVTIFTFGLQISSAFHISGPSSGESFSIWQAELSKNERNLLIASVNDLSGWNTGRKDALDMVLLNMNSDVLNWEFRNYPNVTEFRSLSVNQKPSMVITNQNEGLTLSAEYRGQDFNIQSTPDFQNMTFDDWKTWLFGGEMKVTRDEKILWARADLFPGMGENTNP